LKIGDRGSWTLIAPTATGTATITAPSAGDVAHLAPVDQPIRLFRRGSSEFALPNHVARRLGAASIGLVAASAIVLFMFSPSGGSVPPNFVTKPLPDRGYTSVAAERPNETRPTLKPLIQARLFPMKGNPQTFRGPATKAGVLCQWLADAGFETTAWQRSLIDEREWECTSTLVPVTDHSAGEASKSSLFIAFRGSREGKIKSFRMKINALNSQGADPVTDIALRVLTMLRGVTEFCPPTDVIAAVAQRKPLLLKTGSATYRLAPEISDMRRLNLIVAYFDFPKYNQLYRGKIGESENLLSDSDFLFARGSNPSLGRRWDNLHDRGLMPVEFPINTSTILTARRLAFFHTLPLPDRAKSCASTRSDASSRRRLCASGA
jgi:hypothetical protein